MKHPTLPRTARGVCLLPWLLHNRAYSMLAKNFHHFKWLRLKLLSSMAVVFTESFCKGGGAEMSVGDDPSDPCGSALSWCLGLFASRFI